MVRWTSFESDKKLCLGSRKLKGKTHPYVAQPDYAFWRKSVADVAMSEVDPVTQAPFQLSASDKIATAGSCFAQNVARYLQKAGFNYYVTEPAHAMLPPETAAAYNYGTYTARYGNIYSARQLLQLMQRAYGKFTPQEDVWAESNGRYIDPFRPGIQPDGFASLDEYHADRVQHFAAVRKAFENLDVFIFTLGLTEAWVAVADGSVYTLCPGVAGGEFDAEKYQFINFSAAEIHDDMLAFVDGLREVNPAAKIILTVSPVPLIATAEDRHVLVSTCYSKSALRVACESIVCDREDIVYFPSYEIATGDFTRGAYFAEDLRSITEDGIDHIMSVFIRHYTESLDQGIEQPSTSGDEHVQKMSELADLNCDEEALDPKD